MTNTNTVATLRLDEVTRFNLRFMLAVVDALLYGLATDNPLPVGAEEAINAIIAAEAMNNGD